MRKIAIKQNTSAIIKTILDTFAFNFIVHLQ